MRASVHRCGHLEVCGHPQVKKHLVARFLQYDKGRARKILTDMQIEEITVGQTTMNWNARRSSLQKWTVRLPSMMSWTLLPTEEFQQLVATVRSNNR